MMKISKNACWAILFSLAFIGCNDTSTDNEEQVSQDSGDKKYDPTGYQKVDNNDPKKAATDSMYKEQDSITK